MDELKEKVVLPFDLMHKYADMAISVCESGANQGDQLLPQILGAIVVKEEELRIQKDRLIGIKAQKELLVSLKQKFAEIKETLSKQN